MPAIFGCSLSSAVPTFFFQHGLHDEYLSSKPHVEGELFPLCMQKSYEVLSLGNIGYLLSRSPLIICVGTTLYHQIACLGSFDRCLWPEFFQYHFTSGH